VPPPGSESRFRAFLADPLNLVALAAALVWGSVALFLRPAGDFGVETDFFGGFATFSREWIHGHPNLMDGYRGPAYYLVLGALGALFRDSFLAAKVISVTAAALGLRVVGALVRRLWDTRVAVTACLVVAANPQWIRYSYRAGTDLMFWALFWASMFLMFRGALDGRPGDWARAGALAGLAWLTRYNGSALAPVALVVLAILVRPGGRAARALALFAAAGAVVVAPWCAFLAARTGNPFWSNSYGVIGAGLLVDPPTLATLGSFATDVDLTGWRDVFLAYPQQALAALGRNVWEHALLDARLLAGWPWTAAALAGAAGHLMAGTRQRQVALWAAGAVIYLAMLPVFYSPRFMLVLLPVWAAAVGGVAAWTAALRHGVLRAASRAIPVVAAAVALAASVRGVVASQDPSREGGMAVEIKALAEEATRTGAHFGPDTPIVARKPHIGYYLHAPVIPVGEGNYQGLRDRGGHYLLISGAEAQTYPAFVPLWSGPAPDRVPAPLRFVARVSLPSRAGARIAVLYAIEDPLPYSPEPSSPLHAHSLPRPGYSRLDDLRLRLAVWYTAWNAEADVVRLLGSISPACRERPEVQLALGDALLEKNDAAAAARHYRTALDSCAGGDRDRILLRLATAAAIDRDDSRVAQTLGAFLATQDTAAASGDYAWWDAIGMRYLARREHAAALGAFLGGLPAAQGNPLPLKRLAYSFYALRREEEARRIITGYLGAVPDDGEARSLLLLMDADAARGGGEPAP